MADKSSSGYALRKATSEDVPFISQLGAHVFAVTFGHSVEAHELQKYLEEAYSNEATLNDILSPSKDMIVAVDPSQGSVIGFALLTRGSSEPCIAHLENTIELQRIYVHPDSHGMGIGKLLIQKVEELARDQGFVHMWLGVWEENKKAEKVYERSGYKIVGSHNFVIGGVVQKDWIMLKTL